METLTETPEATTVVHTPVQVAVKQPLVKRNSFSLSWQAEQFEKARFGWMAILMTLQSCVGAIACMFISMNNSEIFPLATGAAITMGSNALFIALAPPRLCLIGFYLSMVVNTIFIITSQI